FASMSWTSTTTSIDSGTPQSTPWLVPAATIRVGLRSESTIATSKSHLHGVQLTQKEQGYESQGKDPLWNSAEVRQSAARTGGSVQAASSRAGHSRSVRGAARRRSRDCRSSGSSTANGAASSRIAG